MNFRTLFVAAACQCLLGVSFAAGASEPTEVPSDIDLSQGPKQVVAKVDECRIRLTLSAGEYFWTSPSYADAVFYKPSGTFSRTRAPYLSKPDVETYSGVYWDYIKPKPQAEPWFGLRCTTATPEPSVYVQANCPAQKKGGDWVLTDAATELTKAKIEAIKGQDWDGFVLSFDAKTKGLRSVVFCAVGGNVLMGQASYPARQASNLESIKKVLQTVEFVD